MAKRPFAACRRIRAHLLMVGGLLAAACAPGAPVRQDRVLEEARAIAVSAGVRVQPSRLVSRRDLPFRLVQKLEPTGRKTVLLHDAGSGDPLPVAFIAASSSGKRAQVAIHRLPVPASTAHEVELAALEHLYSLVLAEEPDAAFCVAAAGRSCDPGRRGRSQGEVLKEINNARTTLVSQRRLSNVMTWRGVSMAAAARRTDQEEVSVVVRDARGPLAGGSVAFHKAPHFGCMATSAADGVASCRLADLHPEEHSHDEHDESPVIATFSGGVQADHVLLPTTLVMKAHDSHKGEGARRK